MQELQEFPHASTHDLRSIKTFLRAIHLAEPRIADESELGSAAVTAYAFFSRRFLYCRHGILGVFSVSSFTAHSSLQ